MRFIPFGCLLLVLAPSVHAELIDVKSILTGVFGKVALTTEKLCEKMKGLPFAKTLNCAGPKEILDSLDKLIGTPASGSCQLTNSSEVPLIVTIDLQFDKKCANVSVGCGTGPGVIPMVASLLQCVLSNLGGLLGKSVPTLLDGGVLGKLPEVLGVVVLILWAVLGKVMALMCKLTAENVTALLMTTVPGLLLGILVAANMGSAQIPALGALVSPLILLVTLIVSLVLPLLPLLGGLLGSILGSVTKLLGPIVNGILAALTGLPAKCGGDYVPFAKF